MKHVVENDPFQKKLWKRWIESFGLAKDVKD